jgi:hypothetical protein
MILTPLWHTEFLVDIKNSNGENIRILVDTWLSDYAVGDLMERTVKVAIDPIEIQTIDLIYISHSHTDHFDPYTLMEIYGKTPFVKGDKGDFVSENSEQNPQSSALLQTAPLQRSLQKPILLLPFTLAYLVPLLREYLGDIQVEILYPKRTYSLKWIEITGYMFSQSDITNEDDVMMIAIASERELLFAEIDTVPDEYDADIATELFRIFDRREYDTRCYLASRNELEWQLRMYDLSGNKKKAYRSEYISGRKEEIRSSYEKYEYEEYIDMDNIMTLPGFVRGYIGQWLQYPTSLSVSLSEISIFPLDEIASMEADIARSFGYEFAQKALIPGRQYRLENGTIETGRKECAIGELRVQSGKWQTWSEIARAYATWPLFPRDMHDIWGWEKKRILEVLNSRFLPYWSASPIASLRDALIKNSGVYRIQFTMNNSKLIIIFEYSLTNSIFIEVPYIDGMHIDEDYWIDDILDFLDGKQDLYSNFWHKLDTKKVYRLWTCLGANFCNNDLVINKYRLHFERALRWETSMSFFEEMKKSLIL